MRELRAVTWQNVHGCRSCDINNECGRCFAAALAEVGDALAPYPRACAVARSRYRRRTGTAMEVTSDAQRGTELGPYRHVEGHRFEVIDDVITAEDEALAARLGWTRRAQGPIAHPGAGVKPGDLVQLRRPGAKRARALQVPPATSKISGGTVDSSGEHTVA